MSSYAEVLKSQPVAGKLIERESIPADSQAVAASVEARVIPDTRIIEVTYTDTDPERAQRAANSLVAIFVEEEVENLGGAEAVAARLLEPAHLPTSPVSPRPLRDGVLGGVLGLALGVGMAFLLKQLDTTLRTREDVEEALSPLPVLAGIPKADTGKDRVLFFENDTRSPASEAVRTLRTNIQFFSVDNPVRLLVVTSPYAEDGKTTVAANLGAAIAASGVKALLIEADLRRPALNEYFNYFDPEKRGGLTDVLAGISRIKDVVRPTHIPNLSFLPAGSLPPNPSELLGSHRMEEVLDEVRDHADVVVIDTPPALAVTDALVLGAKADGVVLVVRAGVTHREKAKEAKDAFDRAGIRLLGMALNDLDMADAQYYYHYYHRYHPRHKKDAQKSQEMRPTPTLLSTSGLAPSPPPKALQDSALREREGREAKVEDAPPDAPLSESPPVESDAVGATVEVNPDAVREERQWSFDLDEAEPQDGEEVPGSAETSVGSGSRAAQEAPSPQAVEASAARAIENHVASEDPLAKLQALNRLMQDEDLLRKVTAMDDLEKAKEVVMEEAASVSGDTVEAISPPEPDAPGGMVLEDSPEPFPQPTPTPRPLDPPIPEPLKPVPDPLEPPVPEPFEPPIPEPLEPPTPEPARPESAEPLESAPEPPPRPVANSQVPQHQLDPDVLRMMREEEDEYEDDLPGWMREPAQVSLGPERAKDIADNGADELDRLGVDTSHLTPRQRKRLRKRIHRLGPDPAPEDVRAALHFSEAEDH